MRAQSACKLMRPQVICNSDSIVCLYLEGGHRHIGQQIAEVDLCCAGRGELAIEVRAQLAENLIAFSFFHI